MLLCIFAIGGLCRPSSPSCLLCLLWHQIYNSQREGYGFAFLLGHSSYYPRYGYQTQTHGFCKVAIDIEQLPESTVALDGCPCGLLLVSHDERFLARLTTTRWRIASDGWDARLEVVA